MKLGSDVLNASQKAIASSPVVLYNNDNLRLTDEIIYDIEGDLTTSPLLAVISTISDELADLSLDSNTDDRRVDFIVDLSDLPELPDDGYYIIYNDLKYNCYQRGGQHNAGKYSDQFGNRYRINTRREGE
jgi:hypothetical protein